MRHNLVSFTLKTRIDTTHVSTHASYSITFNGYKRWMRPNYISSKWVLAKLKKEPRQFLSKPFALRAASVLNHNFLGRPKPEHLVSMYIFTIISCMFESLSSVDVYIHDVFLACLNLLQELQRKRRRIFSAKPSDSDGWYYYFFLESSPFLLEVPIVLGYCKFFEDRLCFLFTSFLLQGVSQ